MLFGTRESNSKDERLDGGVTLGQMSIRLLAYADDIALLGEDLDMIIRLGNKLMNTTEKVSLTVNDDKTEYLMVTRSNRGTVDKNNILK